MTVEDSPLWERLIFVVGVMRSGTNWLQRVLVAHPDVMGLPTETHLFHWLQPFAEHVQHGAVRLPTVGNVFMSRDAFRTQLRSLCDAVFLGYAGDAGGGERFILERTPHHARNLELIGDVYPDAAVVHIIRDGRDVARSLVSQPFGPDTVAAAAEEWRTSIEAARAAAGGLERYHEVRYEELLGAPVAGIEQLYRTLGLDVSDTILERARLEAIEPYLVDASFPSVGAGKWRAAWTAADVRAFDDEAGALLRELGYDGGEPDTPPAAQPARRGLLRRRRDHDERPAASVWPETHRDRQLVALELVERLLGILASGSTGGIDDVLSENALLRVVDDTGEWSGRDRAARDRFASLVAGDHEAHAAQLRGDVHPAVPIYTVVATYRRHDGALAHRILTTLVERGRITALTQYRIG